MPTKKEHSARKARRCFKLPSYRWWVVGGRRLENLEACGMEDFQTTAAQHDPSAKIFSFVTSTWVSSPADRQFPAVLGPGRAPEYEARRDSDRWAVHWVQIVAF